MGPNRNQREVENRLRDAVKSDRARVQIGRISRFGLLEMSRQRLRPSLGESTQSVCPRCDGLGNVRSVESLALAILRLIGEEARKDRTAKVIVRVPVDVGNYLLNEKRDWLQGIYSSNNVEVVTVSDPSLETPNYAIRRVRDDETTQPENAASSYKMVAEKPDPSEEFEKTTQPVTVEAPAVTGVLPATPAPPPTPATEKPKQAKPRKRRSLMQVLFGWLGVGSKPDRKSSSNRGSRSGSGGSRRGRNRRSSGENKGNNTRRARSGSGRAESSKSDSGSRSGNSNRSRSGKKRSQRGRKSAESAGDNNARQGNSRRRNRHKSSSDKSSNDNAAKNGNGAQKKANDSQQPAQDKAPQQQPGSTQQTAPPKSSEAQKPSPESQKSSPPQQQPAPSQPSAPQATAPQPAAPQPAAPPPAVPAPATPPPASAERNAPSGSGGSTSQIGSGSGD